MTSSRLHPPSPWLPRLAGTTLAGLALFSADVTCAQQPQNAAPASAAADAPKHAAAKKKAAGSADSDADTSRRGATSYSLGLSMGEQLRASAVTPADVSAARLAQGVRDGLSGKAKLGPSDQQNISELLRSAQAAAGDVNHKAAARFLEENGKRPGVITTASGLQYKVLTEGSGASPKGSDEVVVNYRGKLLDGTEFDSSYKRGNPATLQIDRVIPGWTEALGLMKPGAKWELYIPPRLAYDLHSRPPIPPGSALIFEVELLSINPKGPTPAPAAAAPAAPAAPAAAPPPPAPK